MDENNEGQFRWPFMIILALVLIGILVYRLSNTLPSTKADTGEAALHVSNVTAVKEVNVPGSLNLKQKQDLTTPGDAEETVPRIEAIFISGKGESCISIRGKVAREGDIVDGFKILKIYPDKVEFEKDGKTTTGAFPPPKTGKTEVRQ